MKPVPFALLQLADRIGIQIDDWTEAGWIASTEFEGVWPPPDERTHFGKRSSCIVGNSIAVSCAEVELSLRLKPGWEGGWVHSTYRPGSTFPDSWLNATITKDVATALLEREYPRTGVTAAAGIPDLVVERDGVVFLLECKREAGDYRNADCEWRHFRGDAPRRSQLAWAQDAITAGIRPDSRITVCWNRKDVARCD
jgi:hypothetical protein